MGKDPADIFNEGPANAEPLFFRYVHEPFQTREAHMFPHEPNVPGSIATALGLRESDCVLNCYYALIVAVWERGCQRMGQAIFVQVCGFS